jgi:flagellar protein FlbT
MGTATLVLDPGEKGIVGSMVVENTTDAAIHLAVEGEGPVLRHKMMIRAEDANTPALKIYYAVMNMYLQPGTFETASRPFLALCRELVEAVPSTGLIMADIGECLVAGDFRGALDKCFDLLRYEEYLEGVARSKVAANDGQGAPA